MDVDDHAARIASAIGEPARARMLFSLMDGRARTSTELAALAEVGASTASVHLRKLEDASLVTAQAQGKHRYYRLQGRKVARVLEGLSVLAGGTPTRFQSTAPPILRAARTCYDHMAGTFGVALHDRILELGWLTPAYEVTAKGRAGLIKIGVDVDGAMLERRRRFAYACLDWSERRPHLAGALGAALQRAAIAREWVTRDLNGRALTVTRKGRRELSSKLGLVLPDAPL
jgi:DNA-binding transcriptional ArsR family regulator